MRRAVPILLAVVQVFLVWGGVCTMPAHAEAQSSSSPVVSKESGELAALRQQYMAKALVLGRPLSEYYANALLGLERDAAAAADYELALAAQRRRLEIAEAYKNAPTDANTSSAIVLHPADAKLTGPVYYDKVTESIIGWRKLGASATWEVKLAPGTYQILLSYSAGTAAETPPRLPTGATAADNISGGELEFFEDSTLVGAESNRRTATVDATAGWNTFATQPLEPLHFQSTTRLTLRCTKLKGGAGLMCLKGIRLTLVPATTPAPSAPIPNEAAGHDELTRLQDIHLQRVKALAQPITDAYMASLAALEQGFTKQQDTESLAAVALERGRVQKWMENPTTPTPSRTSAFRSALTSAGLTVLADDARFVPDATNSGDCFRVAQDGKEFVVRLMWVTCPPPNSDNKAELEQHAKYFGITADDAETVGKEAQDFSTSLLADKSLRILSSGQRDKDQHLFAMVVPEGMENLANVLVDNGLAAVNPSPQRKPTSKRYEATVLETLKQREIAARQRPIAPGAWAFAIDPPKSTAK